MLLNNDSRMIDVIKVASYLMERYRNEVGRIIDEMKLHKLLYLSQRESIIRTDMPMFEAAFAAWKYGPVIEEVRRQYRANALNIIPTEEELLPYKDSLDYIFENYARKDSWTLSILTHGESSWQKARKGYAQDAHCDVLIDINDIREDAKRIKMRRFFFEEIAPKLEEHN